MNKKIIKTEQHPNWKEGILVYYEDGTKDVFPRLEEFMNSSIRTKIEYLDLNGRELKPASYFGF